MIAEIGLNHGGSIDRALALVDSAADAGASAVKLQTLFARDLVAASCPPPAHVDSESLQDFFAAFELDEDAHDAIARRARARGLAFMATPFSESAVDLLDRVGIDALKIASGDVTWHGLIERCARTGKPLVISTGMANFAETTDAVAVAVASGAAAIALLHCVSAYPVPRGSENLRAIATLARSFRVPVGLSDHAPDASSVPVAIALGASIYERHLVLERGDGSIDDAVSSTPDELAALIRTAGHTQVALGSGEKRCLAAEAMNIRGSRRGLYATRRLEIGHVVRESDVVALRPENGLPAMRYRELIEVRLTRDVQHGAPFLEADLPSHVESRRRRDVA